jgi:hypothetical protein
MFDILLLLTVPWRLWRCKLKSVMAVNMVIPEVITFESLDD